MNLKRIFLLLTLLLIPQLTNAALTINTINYNSEDAIDIVFIADGFTAAEQSTYESYVAQAVGYLFDNPPFDTESNKFNIYSIPTVSNESGISVQGGISVDTFLKTHLNENNLPRLTGLPDESRSFLRNELKKVFKKKIYPIIIMNTGVYGGSGELNREPRFMSVTQVTLDTEYHAFRELLVHEFGHSFIDLADEYGGDCSSSEVDDWDIDHYDKKNVTQDATNNRKWDDLVTSPQYILGANYCDTDWYRSSPSDIMRSVGSGNIHNELGQILAEERIEEDIDYNTDVVSFQDNGLFNLSSYRNQNIRIHADEISVRKDVKCKNLYVAEDSHLILEQGSRIICDTVDILGSVSYVKKNNSSGVSLRFGCKDPNAKNYTRFARHRQSMCVYGYQDARPPHFILSSGKLLSVNNHDHEHLR